MSWNSIALLQNSAFRDVLSTNGEACELLLFNQKKMALLLACPYYSSICFISWLCLEQTLVWFVCQLHLLNTRWTRFEDFVGLCLCCLPSSVLSQFFRTGHSHLWAGAADHPPVWGWSHHVSWFPPEVINHAGVGLKLRLDSLAVLLFALNLAVIWTWAEDLCVFAELTVPGQSLDWGITRESLLPWTSLVASSEARDIARKMHPARIFLLSLLLRSETLDKASPKMLIWPLLRKNVVCPPCS